MKNAKDTYIPGFAIVDPDFDMGSTEERFHSAGDLAEGVSGKLSMDTTFENTSEEEVQRPRSGDAPVDTKLGNFPQRRY